MDGESLAGALVVLYGRSDGLAAIGSQAWSQDSARIPDRVEFADHFGVSLAAANSGRSPEADLAVGVPFEEHEVGGVEQDHDAVESTSSTGRRLACPPTAASSGGAASGP